MSAMVILPKEGDVALGGFVTFKLAGHQTDGSLAVIEHQVAPGTLAAPLHTHQHEHEISYILEGTITVQLGERVILAPPGTLVFKPRGEPRTFWNQGNVLARLLEMITPAGFERYFAELHELVAPPNPPNLDRIIALAQHYGLALDFNRVNEIVQNYGVHLPIAPSRGVV